MRKIIGFFRENVQIHCEKSDLIQGSFLILLGILLPLLLQERSFGVYASIRRMFRQEQAAMLMAASLQLVLMNCVRALPHYLGVFIINSSLSVRIRGKRMFIFNILFTFGVISMVYRIIYLMYHIMYDFGVPAFVLVTIILYLSYLNLFSVDMVNRIIILASLLLSIQWLDVVPWLSEYGFGRGEISRDLKVAADLMGYEAILGVFALCMCAAFFFCSAIHIQVLYKEHKLRIATMHSRKMEAELHDTKLQALWLRSYSEVQTLVHDLKTPLTTVQGLVSLSEMMESSPQIREYLEKISGSVNTMNTMISEILYENHKEKLTAGELIYFVSAQVSIYIPTERIQYVNECPEALILGNRIRLSRAIINTIDNAYHAIDKETGQIRIHVYREEAFIVICISDNGKGIPKEKLKDIWLPGYSESDSTGLGLGFTKQVIENHAGQIDIESEWGKYTRVYIRLREEEA